MRVLLDECIDRRFAKEIIGHEVSTVPQKGWAGIKNGDLLSLAQEEFDVFVTVDRNLAFQQISDSSRLPLSFSGVRAIVSLIFGRSYRSYKLS